MDILLSPHNDDETLFAAYTCMRLKPLVVVCLRSFVEARPEWGGGGGPTWQVREAETAAACQILGCRYLQWMIPDDALDLTELQQMLDGLKFDAWRVFAPLPEEGGHVHHNPIGELAAATFDDVRFYSTYTSAGKTTTGVEVIPTPDEIELKQRAMRCYPSQANHPATQAAFNTWKTEEYLTLHKP